MYKKIILIAAILTLVGCSSSKSPIVTTKTGNPKYKKTETKQSAPRAAVTSDLINGYVFPGANGKQSFWNKMLQRLGGRNHKL
jgi:hypothetical protein